MRRLLKWTLGLSLIIAINLGAIVLAAKILDTYGFAGSTSSSLPGHDLATAERTARTLDLFPYEGWHVQANTSVGDFRLGSMGFAIDFDLLKPPPKAPGEYRIILIGGSGAQGWGATATQNTMAALLERKLNDRRDGTHYRVINLAMGSSLTYQNFIALNRWAHPLKPDLILSYSGVNDYVVPLIHEEMRDAHYFFNELDSLAIASRASEMPAGLGWLARLMPNMMTHTSFGYGLKYAVAPRFFLQRAEESYDRAYGRRYSDPNAFMDEVVTPNYIHALQSIRRDFGGVPTLIVLQALHASEVQAHLNYVPALRKGYYERMYDRVRAELTGTGWHLANFYAFNRDHPSHEIAVHPTDKGQAALADYVYARVDCILRNADPACMNN